VPLKSLAELRSCRLGNLWILWHWRRWAELQTILGLAQRELCGGRSVCGEDRYAPRWIVALVALGWYTTTGGGEIGKRGLRRLWSTRSMPIAGLIGFGFEGAVK
jgi:hypothetical protein